MNKVILTGRLTKDPELNFTQNGAAYCIFTVAVDKYSKDGEKDADFVQCICWNKTAENLAKYMSKGRQIAIDGRIDVSSYEKDGQRHWKTQVVCMSVEFLGSGGGQQQTQAQQQQQPQAGSFGQDVTAQFADADLPF